MYDHMDLKLHMLEAITNNFSEDHKVGSGGFGDVYRGVYEGKEIAVKKLHQLQGLDNKLFDSEFRNLSTVDHENIVKLIGYCYEVRRKFMKHDGQLIAANEMERLLCFEYMQGGTLESHITDESCNLDWSTCYQIIRGTCDGINHLHTAYEKPIFHLDLKPANILLDAKKKAKIADLGLSKVVFQTKTYQTQNITGSMGYMPPEFIDSGSVSKKFDVFSVGVIIIKLMDGNEGYSHYRELGLEKFIQRVCENWNKRLQQMHGHPSHEIEILRVKKCVEIASRCVVRERNNRPFISDVVSEFEELEAEIKKMLLTSDEPKGVIVQRSCDSNVLAIDPTLELRFPYEPRKEISCCLQLTNITNGLIAFNIMTNETKYRTQPRKGMIAPCSKRYVYVTLLAQDESPPTMHCDDMFLVQSANINKDLTSDEITDFFRNAVKQKVVDVVKLPIVHVALDEFSC